jgi:hypothetical protein
MPDTLSAQREKGPSGRTLWVVGLLMACVLALLFYPSLQPGQVLFSNDGPLGATSAEAAAMPSLFFGYWQDLNWIGIHQPSSLPNVSGLLGWVLGPVLSAKFYAPVALLFLGFSAWVFLRAAGMHPVVCTLGALAAALNGDAFSHACWGLGSIPLAMGFAFLAFAALIGSPARRLSLKLFLAGLAAGMSVMEGFDVGAILSLYIAAFALFQSSMAEGDRMRNTATGLLRVSVIALFAAVVAAQGLITLISTQVQGVVGMGQNPESRQQRWHEATQWSLPKVETLTIAIPGLFGYRIDTPEGGAYWGGVGRNPRWDDYVAARHPELANVPTVELRHSGAGFYAGVLVAVGALWALVHSFRRKQGLYDDMERRFIWFWSVTALVSLLLAFGRHAPFYQFIYALPFFSTIRNPIKFLHPFQISLIILFAYGLHGWWRGCVSCASVSARSPIDQIRLHWNSCRPADRRWVIASGVTLAVLLVSWLTYASSQPELASYLQKVGFNDPRQAAAIAAFSVRATGWSVLFFTLSAAMIALIMSGVFSGTRARWAGVLLGVLLVTDLTRANAPWVLYYDYREKYASNPVVDLLRHNPHEQRVAARLMPMAGLHLVNEQGRLFPALHNEWLQHHFPYYQIQSLDIVQLPRRPELDEAFMAAFQPASDSDFTRIGRLWELSNTRYFLGMTGFLTFLNQQLDPVHQRFRVHTAFHILAKPGVQQVSRIEDLTAQIAPDGLYAVFEFEGALPRARLFHNWSVPDDPDEPTGILQRLIDPEFDPHQTVLVGPETAIPAPSASGSNPGGIVEFVHYEPKRIRLRAQTDTPAILLLNDRHHHDWRVTVDDAPAALLRCNFIMRGVHLEPGDHMVEFQFRPPVVGLYVSLTAIALGLALLVVVTRAKPVEAPPPPSTAAPSRAAGDRQRKPDPGRPT